MGNPPPPRLVAWMGAPKDDMMVINVDDGAIPLRVTLDLVVWCVIIVGLSSWVSLVLVASEGQTSVLHVEILGVWHGPRSSVERGFSQVACYSDSLNVVRLI